jgi:hypothetical protein
MQELKPQTAAELASDVYLVQNERLLPAFLSRPEFSSKAMAKKPLAAQVGGRFVRAARDAFGVCALGGKNNSKELFLIFRGSTTANRNADWVSNGRIGVQFSNNGLPVHIGFNGIFNSMLNDIKTFLTDINNDFRVVHCIGHSLGGAVATLAADWISSATKKPVYLYTFGAPRPGLLLFSANLTSKLNGKRIFRTYHATDPVPMIPLYPFMHAPCPGYGHCIPSNENIISAQAHDRVKYIESVTGQTWPSLERRAPPHNHEHAIEAWLQSKIPVNAASPKIWHWINAALIWVLKKILGPLVIGLQSSFMGLMTLADMIAWALKRGIDFKQHATVWVMHLMRKIMEALGMKTVKKEDELTQTLMRNVLKRAMDKTNVEARKAVMRIE